MKAEKNNQISTSIKRFRRLCIGSSIAIAILTTVMIFQITSALDETAATRINIAGRQRMLAQKTLTNALAIDSAAHKSNWNTLEPSLRQLNQTINDLTDKHNILSDLNAQSTTTELQDAYQAIDRPFKSIIKSGAELNKLTLSMIRRAPYLDAQTLIRVTAAKAEIEEAHAQFLPGMENIVALHEEDYKSQIKRSIKKAKLGIVFLLVILTTTILFVIEPAILMIRRQIQDLEKANRAAQKAESVRWRLLTNIGHEFRTPMNAIMGFADLLKEDDLSDTERSRLVNSVFDSSTELTSLIETMLDMSAAESGQLRVTKQRCDLNEILVNLKAKVSSKANSRSININLIVDKDCPQYITTDPKRLTQILNQITDNALKFTEKGFVNIQAKLLGDPKNHLLEIKIIDTGIGIDPKNLKSIFDPFQQAEDSLTRDFGGAGLGLSVSRDVARVLGGDIAVESTYQQGSTFTITIDPGEITVRKAERAEPQPQEQAPEQTPQEPPKPLDNRKVLVVDDAKDNRMLLKHILKKTGAELEFAVDGKQALEAIEMATEIEQPFDIVLMDMQMPVMDGYFATSTLRENGNDIPVIAVTAHALEGDREHCLDSGCNEYLTKPVKKKLLIETCVRLLDEHEQKTQSKAA